MSFNSDLKNELCSASFACKNCPLAEALGIMLYAQRFASDGIKIQVENPNIRKRIVSVAAQALGISLRTDGNTVFTDDPSEIRKAFSAFGYDNINAPLQLNHALLEDDCCRNAFLRGVLLVGGCITSPEKGYHLEIVTGRYHVAKQTSALLSEMGIPLRTVRRRGNNILYYKDSSVIEDVLSASGGTNAAMEIMLKKVERDLNNNVNRKVNCDTANLDKVVDAAAKQLAAISRLEKSGRISELSSSLRETADLRKAYPELSLSALCELHDPPISKQGLNNRFRRIIKLSEEKAK